jgi:hypothetical protein
VVTVSVLLAASNFETVPVAVIAVALAGLAGLATAALAAGFVVVAWPANATLDSATIATANAAFPNVLTLNRIHPPDCE